MEFFDYWTPWHASFWYFFDALSAVLIGGLVPGLIGGALTSVFSNRQRHPIALASLWASILATPELVVIFFFHEARPMAAVLSIAMCLSFGGGYGFLSGVVARLIERWLEKRRLRRLELATFMEQR